MPLTSRGRGLLAAGALLVLTSGIVAAATRGADQEADGGGTGPVSTTTASAASPSTAPTGTAPATASTSVLGTTADPDPLQPATTTTTAVALPTPTAPTTAPPANPCPPGTADLNVATADLRTDESGSSFEPRATVENRFAEPIEVARLEVIVRYADGERTIVFDTAGIVIPAGAGQLYVEERVVTPTRYLDVRIGAFAWFVASRPECRTDAPTG